MELFLTAFFLSVSLALDLGIVNVAILKTGFEKGFRASLFLGLGSALADMVYVGLTMFGMSYITDNLLVRKLLWICGTIVLLIFAIRTAIQIFVPPAAPQKSIQRITSLRQRYKYFFIGFMLSLSSPTSILWFATIGGSIIATNHLQSQLNLVYFYGGFFMASVLWAFLLAYLSYKGGKQSGTNLRRYISIVSAVVFLVLAGYVFVQGYRTFL